MKQMVMMVLNNPDHSMMLLEAWEAAGAPAITILESSSLIRLRQASARDDIPLMPSLFNFLRGKETHHRTIFSVVDDETQAQALIKTTERVFEDMTRQRMENSGVLFVLPVSETHRFTTGGDKNSAAKN
jgi:hypothetical protein